MTSGGDIYLQPAWDSPVGRSIELRKLKWGKSTPEWTAPAQVEQASRHELTAAIASGAPFTFADGSVRHAQEPSTYRFDRRTWSHVMELVEPAVHWYANITTPPQLQDGVLAWHDIELDLEAFPDGSWWLSDIPEFAHAVPAYPPRFKTEAVRAALGLADRVERGEAPFQTGAGPGLYGPEEHVSWLARGAGDGIAFVGATGGPVGDATAERLLNRFNPARALALDSAPSALMSGIDAPRDGVMIVGCSAELPALARLGALLVRSWPERALIRLVTVTETGLDPRDDLRAALAGGDGAVSGSMHLHAALDAHGVPPRGTLSFRRFLAAVWF